ncbi:hypothetical protein [Thermococcus alcaliphilus]|uniref:hypothetical protein n=1 Tax=Thermococcus alcaliphilus TaxID=139207 RepID=UPI002090D9F9|nr:hypothetical protein [Thermococcus alcaliphilus]MCO6041846.1 hypothetical protein [Thermococcus alcaliphilus]
MITRERLVEEFRALDEKAMLMGSDVVRLYLIGGGNLALRGLKEATADIDVVVENLNLLKKFESILTNPSPQLKTSRGLIIYVKVAEHEYEKKLGAYSVYRKLDPQMEDFNLDVFVKRVMRGIILTESMKKRSIIPKEFQDLNKIRVYLISLEDLFLFKGVTSIGRSKDVDDLIRLIEVGVDFNVILEELNIQKDLIGKERFELLVNLLMEKMVSIREILGVRGLRSSGLEKFIISLEELMR